MSCWQAAAKEAAAVKGNSNASSGGAWVGGKVWQDIKEVAHLLIQCRGAELQAHVPPEGTASQRNGGSSCGVAAMGAN